jgi:hypothetical protein
MVKRGATRIVSLTLIVSGLILSLALTDPVPAQTGPAIELSPSSGAPGDDMTIQGFGFLPPGPVTLFLDNVGGIQIGTSPVDGDGEFDFEFSMPNATPGFHVILACNSYNPSAPPATQCRQTAVTDVTITRPTTTSSSTPESTTSSTAPTTTLAGTTTSSLSLSGPTTTVGPDPPGPDGPGALIFTTTSTSLDLPGEFANEEGQYWPDLEITGVEVTQGIQDLSNRMPLVAGKRTMVRVYVAVEKIDGETDIGDLTDDPGGFIGPEGWSPVDGLLYLQRAGEETFIYPDNDFPITAYREGSDRHQPDQTLNFNIPPDWAQGEVSITAFIWSDHPDTALYAETDSGNNFAQGTVTFHDAVKPQVLVWRLDPVGYPFLSDIAYPSAVDIITESFQMRHPVDAPNFIIVFPPLGPGPIWGDGEPSDEWDFEESPSEPNLRMKWVYYTSSLDGGIRFIGLIYEDTPRAWAGLANTPVAWSIPNETTPAHEAAHFYGVNHAPCKDDDDNGIPDELDGGSVDWEYPHGLPFCSIGPIDPEGFYGANLWSPTDDLIVYSNDPAHSNVRFPWMGYLHPRWTDTYHYCLMGIVYQIPCNPASLGVPPQELVPPVDCGPAQGNGFELDLCLATEEPQALLEVGPPGNLVLAVPEGPHPSWVLVEVDPGLPGLGDAAIVGSNSGIEAEFSAIVESTKQGDHSPSVMLRVTDSVGHIMVQIPFTGAGEAFEEGVLPQLPDLEALPWPDGAAALDLLVDGVVVDTLTPSSAPVVAINPVEAQLERRFDVSWTSQDADGDSLLHTLSWSADGGNTWMTVDSGFPDTSASIDADLLHIPGGQIHLRVLASDGLTTGSAVAGPFALPSGAPTGLIAAPETVMQFQINEITFHAYDPEDGVIESGVWASDMDGDLGEGRLISTRFLSAGTHQISVDLADSEGNAVTLTHTLEVLASDIPAPRQPGAVPEAEEILTVFPDLESYTSDQVSTAEDDPEAIEDPVQTWWLWVGGGVVALLVAGLLIRRRREA